MALLGERCHRYRINPPTGDLSNACSSSIPTKHSKLNKVDFTCSLSATFGPRGLAQSIGFAIDSI